MKILFIGCVLLLVAGCTPSNHGPASEAVEMIELQKTTKINHRTHPKLYKKITRSDPSSGEKLTYWGYNLMDILPSGTVALEIIAIDGYKLTKTLEELKQAKAFLALSIEGVSEKGIYNPSLKTYFDWRPGYILFEKSGGSSPYQVHKIKPLKELPENPILMGLSGDAKKGANIFIKTCSKCHSYKSFGGIKAPPINVLLQRWNKVEDLKPFLRNPMQVKPRLKGMSPFEGSDEELELLLVFLGGI